MGETQSVIAGTVAEPLTVMPPPNPFLRTRWIELGLMPAEDGNSETSWQSL